MNKDLKALKSQLKEVAELLNEFQSEKVQLKLLSMLVKTGYLEIGSVKKVKSSKAGSIEKEPEKEKKKNKMAEKAQAKKENQEPAEGLKVEVPVEIPSEQPVSRVKRARKTDQTANTSQKKRSVKNDSKAAGSSKKVSTSKKKNVKSSVGRPVLASRPGPTEVLKKLLEEGYFSEARSLNDITSYCNSALGWVLQSTDISGILTGMVRKELLVRRKSTLTGKYEYIKQ